MTSQSVRAGGVRKVIRRHPVATYYVLACVLSWSLTPLLNVSLAFGLLAPFEQRLIFSAAGFALVAAAVVGLAWQRFMTPSDVDLPAVVEPVPL